MFKTKNLQNLRYMLTVVAHRDKIANNYELNFVLRCMQLRKRGYSVA